MIINKNGKVRYYGDKFVKKIGLNYGKISKREFRNLSKFIKESGYFNLESHYSIPVSDGQYVFTMVVFNGKRKIVKNYFNSGPIKLWAVEQLIDKLVLETEWLKSVNEVEKKGGE